MKKPLKFLLGAVQNGIPFITTAKNLFVKKKLPDNLHNLPVNDLIGIINKQHDDQGDRLYNILKLIAESVVIWGFAYAIKNFGISLEDIVTLGGLIKL